MEKTVPVMEPFAQACQELTSECKPTLGAVYPVNRTLWNVCTPVESQPRRGAIPAVEGDSKVVKDFKLELRRELRTRFNLDGEGYVDNEMLSDPKIIAASLDPRYCYLKSMNHKICPFIYL